MLQHEEKERAWLERRARGNRKEQDRRRELSRVTVQETQRARRESETQRAIAMQPYYDDIMQDVTNKRIHELEMALRLR